MSVSWAGVKSPSTPKAAAISSKSAFRAAWRLAAAGCGRADADGVGCAAGAGDGVDSASGAGKRMEASLPQPRHVPDAVDSAWRASKAMLTPDHPSPEARPTEADEAL